MKKVTIVVPVYNVSEFLNECIDSLVSQTYVNLEIILINDGSTDNSGSICDDYASKDNRIRVIHQTNKGVSSARNAGLQVATGDYVTFVDPDDWVELSAIKNMVDLIEHHDVDCVRTTYYENRGAKQAAHSLKIRNGLYEVVDRYELLASFIRGEEGCYVVLLMMKKELVHRIGGFVKNIPIMEDKIFYVNLVLAAETILISNVVTYHYRVNLDSASRASVHYLRNAKSVIEVNHIIISSLKKASFEASELISLTNLTHVNIIANYMFQFYKNVHDSRSSINELFAYLQHNEDYQEMIQNCRLSDLPFHLRYTVSCITNGSLKKMLFFFKFRLALSDIKDRALSR